ncbi:14536_t:CDS:2 [Cetraspora pellucida]|uniref:14536_t:CDS:1 n=1 Tax=Cetraspora pellucida TaxID=1433469 RepID=A0A9N9FK29_9GLOM|nr:14536_t:CDS:2 [Cetraspora pellucida]
MSAQNIKTHKRNKIQTHSQYSSCTEQNRKNKKAKQLRNKSSNESVFSLSLTKNVFLNKKISENDDNECKDGYVKFSTMVEIKKEFISNEILSSEFDYEEKFCNIVNTLIVSLQKELGYYWKLRNLYINKKK